MSNHEASEQLLGYLYQVRCALYLLLCADDNNAKLSIEKFDDIAFSEEGIPIELIQTKHHVGDLGNLTNASTDVWRTIKSWIDSIVEHPDLLETTKFTIITNSNAPEGSATFYLKNNTNRDSEKAYNILLNTTRQSRNQAHKAYYDAFTNLDENHAKLFISKIQVIDSEKDIINLKSSILKYVRYSCLAKFENDVYNRLEGWWFENAIKSLKSEIPLFFTHQQVRSKLINISDQYREDNLPIDINLSDKGYEMITPDSKVFCKQLSLINASEAKISLAIRDYYRAYIQRSNWVRNNLLYVNELEEYERKLVEEWEHYFVDMTESLYDEDEEPSDELKTTRGKELYRIISNLNIRIRERCGEPFVMRGSYHLLADEAKVGWHTDFCERLNYLLEVGE